MPISLQKPRHLVEKSDNLVRVTLPSKRNIFRILFVCLWFIWWGYMVYAILYIVNTLNKAVEIGENSTTPVQAGSMFFFVIVCFSLFFLALLALGVFGLYRLSWLIAGKEVIEATRQTLTITRQIFQWRVSKQYSAEEISGLRTNMQELSVFLPGKRVKKFLGGSGMITFDYGGRTTSFGLDIGETEAKLIILALQEELPQPNAG